MAIIFMEGFDNIDEVQLSNGAKFTHRDTDIVISSSYARFSGSGIQMNEDNASELIKDFPLTTYTTMVMGVAVNILSSTPTYSAGSPVFSFMENSGTNNHIRIHFLNTKQIAVYNFNGTLLGTTPFSLSNNIWHYLEIKVHIHDTIGTVDIQVDGTSWLSLSNQDTRNGGSGYIDRWRMGGLYFDQTWRLDDLYIDDSDFHGDVRILTLPTTSDGTHIDFTPSAGNRYECVDEFGGSGYNSDIDYVYSNSLGAQQTFKFTTGSLGTVHAVQLSNVTKKDNAGIVETKNLCRSNSTDYISAAFIPSANYTYHQNVWETDPDDSNAWTQTKLEAAEFGLQITSVP